MNESIKALSAEATANWEEVASQVDGEYSQGLEMIGLSPTVESLTKVCKYRMPDYSLVSPSQNKRAILFGIAQSTLLSISTEKTLYVSDDGHVAAMRCGKDCVFILSDENGRLREVLYRSRQPRAGTE